MTSESNDDWNSGYEALCTAMGRALLNWQQVEHACFGLFLKMLGSHSPEIASIVFYNIESFHVRRKILEGMTHYFLADRKDRSDWQEISKALKDANDQRNILAHYDAKVELINEHETSDGRFELEISCPRLQSPAHNLANKLAGRTPDKPTHNIGPTEIDAIAIGFQELAERVGSFRMNIPYPQQPTGLEWALGTKMGWGMENPRLTSGMGKMEKDADRPVKAVAKPRKAK